MKYNTLFFDIDNTLLDFSSSERKAIRRVMDMNGIPATDENAALYSEINRKYWEAFERGEIEREAIFTGRFNELVERLGTSADPEKLSADYFVCLSEGHDVIPGAEDILRWVRERGIRVYAATNGVAQTQYKRIGESGLEGYFSGIFISEEIGAKKPEKAFFDYIISRVPDCNKNRVLVIGDSPSSDILGGINAGLSTCLYNPNGVACNIKPTYEISRLDELKSILM